MGHDIVFDHVGFAYDSRETVLQDVSFTAKAGGGHGTGGALRLRQEHLCPGWQHGCGTTTEGQRSPWAAWMSPRMDPEVLLSRCTPWSFRMWCCLTTRSWKTSAWASEGATDEEVRAAAKAANCGGVYPPSLPTGLRHPHRGEWQRSSPAANASASPSPELFLKDAPIVLLDEATASLDVENETKVQGGPLPSAGGQDRAGHCPPDAHRSWGGSHRGSGEWPCGRTGDTSGADAERRPLPAHGGASEPERPVEVERDEAIRQDITIFKVHISKSL